MSIYKDECIYTFDNQESTHGVDVCLTCFIGTSPDPQHDFTSQHGRITGHTAYLNMRKEAVPRKQVTDNSPSKVPKLGFTDTNDKEFELVNRFKTLAQDSESQFNEAIQKVINADSYTKAQQLESWELELQPCEHVGVLESLFASREKSTDYTLLSHCSECDLDKNLWFCLECGNIGCGRRQFDGVKDIGGNGHGLSHYETTQHPLAVKLGSITPDGHVDVFCYACNDDVKDPNIKEHLGIFGIDISKHTKTEKSMTELQLEQNMSWDFTSSDNGIAVHGPGLTGMKNLGNTCYMNSIVQCLFNIPDFSSKFKPNDPNSDTQGEPTDLFTQLRKLSDGLGSGRYEAISPDMFKHLVGQGHSEFATAQQQDAFEYLSYLLTKISQKVKTPVDLPGELFGFETERRIKCIECDAVRYVVEKQENISVQVPIEQTDEGDFKPVTMKELLNIYTHSDIIESKCPKCSNLTAESSVKFKTFPNYLLFNVRRFRIVNWVPQKVDVPVIESNEIKLDEYLSAGPQENENVISNDEEKEDPVDPEQVVMLSSMGFPEALCKHALKLAKDKGFEAAVELVISGEAQSSMDSGSSSNVDPEHRVMLESMGFSTEQATAALQHNSNMEAAVEWLFAGNFDTLPKDSSPQTLNTPRGNANLPAEYSLSSLVCHKGASVHVGHYVAALKKHNKTILFNDEKVTEGSDVKELEKFAYIYVFARK